MGVAALLGGACGDAATSTDGPATTTSPTTTAADTTSGSLTVMSSDGTASLEIPAGALPSDVDPAAITIDPVSADAEAPQVAALLAAGFVPGPAYRLGPEGVVFEEPVLLRVSIPSDGRMLAGFMVGAAELEPLDVADGAVGEEAVFALAHFSVVDTFFGPFWARLFTPGQAIVDAPFTVRSQVFRRFEALASGAAFSLSGHLLAGTPLDPTLNTAAPPPTAVPIGGFTSVYTLTCTDEGTALILHGVAASVARADLTDYGVELAPGTGADVRMAGSLSAEIECVAPTVETPQMLVAGVYDGPLDIVSIPGLPGGDYSDAYQLVLQDCGRATLTQRSTQDSHGALYHTQVGYEVPPVDSNFFFAHAAGRGTDYAEVYSFGLEVLEDGSLAVNGVAVGGGHGFGEVLPENLLWFHADLITSGGTALNPDFFTGAGWVNGVEGTLTRTGDAPPCD